MLLPGLQVVADDLSGAAECAAALAPAASGGGTLVLKGAFPSSGSWAVDTDSRAQTAGEAAAVAAVALARAGAGRAPGNLLFKKIDSTLRGNVAAELRAALDVPGLVRAAVVCPALPAQGRTLRQGVLHVSDQSLLHTGGRPLDLLRLLGEVDVRPVLLRPGSARGAVGLAEDLAEAIGGGARAIAIDARDDADLQEIAEALATLCADVPLLAVGSAGLAWALASLLGQAPGRSDQRQLARPGGSFVAVAGSFSPVTLQQVDALAQQPDVHLVRLAAQTWLGEPNQVAQAMAQARTHGAQGRSVVLAACGSVPAASSRALVQRMAGAAEPLLHGASTLLLTGGDTARAVLDLLGVERLQVMGELESGICLSRRSAESTSIVTKAGGFGDRQSLVRVLRHFKPLPQVQSIA
jgi:uncharacterized protein YgbK (DUF1537 family)